MLPRHLRLIIMERKKKKKKKRKGSTRGCHGGGRSLRVAQRDAEVMRARRNRIIFSTCGRSSGANVIGLKSFFKPPLKKKPKKNLILTAWIRSTQLPTDVQQPPLLQSFNGYNIRYLFFLPRIRRNPGGPPDCARRSADSFFVCFLRQAAR